MCFLCYSNKEEKEKRRKQKNVSSAFFLFVRLTKSMNALWQTQLFVFGGARKDFRCGFCRKLKTFKIGCIGHSGAQTERGEGLLVNLKEYIPQIYELRLAQSSSAILHCFIKHKRFFPKIVRGDLEQDKKTVDGYLRKMVEKGQNLTDKEVDNLLSIYLFHSYVAKEMCKAKNKHSRMERYATCFLAVCCISEYFQMEAGIHEHLNIPVDPVVYEIVDICSACKGLLVSMAIYEEVQKSQEQLQPHENVAERLTEPNTEQITKNIEDFISDYLDEVLFPVNYEHGRQVQYTWLENKRLTSRHQSKTV